MKTHFVRFTVILLVAIGFGSCDNEYELDKSIFIPDKDYPSLPAYTEWGYNTFGALYNREPFVNSDFSIPTKIICTIKISPIRAQGNIVFPVPVKITECY